MDDIKIIQYKNKYNLNIKKIKELMSDSDILGLYEIQEQIEHNLNIPIDAKSLLIDIIKLNYILIDTEIEKYAGKYNIKVQDLYIEMKIDLLEMLDIDIDWFFDED